MAAMSFVRSGMQVPERSMVVGMPARVLRTLNDDEVAAKTRDTEDYIALVQRSRDTMREVEALVEPELGRRRVGETAKL